MRLQRKYLITWSAVLLACTMAVFLYYKYSLMPWTRDAQVQANIVGIAPRVDGPIIRIPVVDNQPVKKGDLLFEIDPSTYQAAVDNANAKLQQAEAAELQGKQELDRQTVLYQQKVTDLRDFQDAQDNYAALVAARVAAQAELETAKLNLSYTQSFAPVDGFLTNVNVSPGTYLAAGQQILTLIDGSSFWIAAYFKETQLSNIKEGASVEVFFMGHPLQPVRGVVKSLGWGIFIANGSTVQMLPDVSPTIDWVRLAQRFPVRVELTEASPIPLRIGLTASVAVRESVASAEKK